jgi:hypothetical protein
MKLTKSEAVVYEKRLRNLFALLDDIRVEKASIEASLTVIVNAVGAIYAITAPLSGHQDPAVQQAALDINVQAGIIYDETLVITTDATDITTRKDQMQTVLRKLRQEANPKRR